MHNGGSVLVAPRLDDLPVLPASAFGDARIPIPFKLAAVAARGGLRVGRVAGAVAVLSDAKKSLHCKVILFLLDGLVFIIGQSAEVAGETMARGTAQNMCQRGQA